VFPPSEQLFPFSELVFPPSEQLFPFSELVFPLSKQLFPFSELVFPPSEQLFSFSELVFPPSEQLFPFSELVFPPSEQLFPFSEPVFPPSEQLFPFSELVFPPSEQLFPFSELVFPPSEQLFPFSERQQADRSPHGRDGLASFFCDAKSHFKGTLVGGRVYLQGRQRLTAFEPRFFRIITNAGTCEHDGQISRLGREAPSLRRSQRRRYRNREAAQILGGSTSGLTQIPPRKQLKDFRTTSRQKTAQTPVLRLSERDDHAIRG
jgi:hypothetical protein